MPYRRVHKLVENQKKVAKYVNNQENKSNLAAQKPGELKFEQLLEEIKHKHFYPVYLLFGLERYLIDELYYLIKEMVLGDVFSDFDFDLLDGDSTSIPMVINYVNTPALMQEQRLVVVKNVDWFRGGKKEKLGAKDRSKNTESDNPEEKETSSNTQKYEPLIEYFKNPNPETVLVILAPGEVDRRRKLYRTLIASGIAVECKPLNDQERRSWLLQKAKDLGLYFDSSALDYLITFGGKSLYSLKNELEKLKIYFNGEKSRVSHEVVQELCFRNIEDRIFDVTAAIAQKNIVLAVNRIRELIQAGVQPQRIFYLLVRHYRILLKSRAVMDQSYDKKELASKLEVDPRIVFKYMQEARGISWSEIVNTLKQMLEIDVAIKTGKGSIETYLELLLADLSENKRSGRNL